MGMHPTAHPVGFMFLNLLGAAGDAWRYAPATDYSVFGGERVVMTQRWFGAWFAGFIGSALLLAVTVTTPAAAPVPQGGSADAERDGLFAGYPKSAAFDSIVYSHRDFGRKSKDLMLYATWLVDGDPRVAYQCFASLKGDILTYRDVFNWALQASHRAQLDEPQLESLKNSIKALPEGAKHPPLADLLIVSFRDGETWETRTYDRKKLPDAVKDIYKVTDCTNWYERP
ncbi:MAG TPA: hypothetical protein VJ866_19250 [Pyrinomonadaceae bacterium]|nr:hypothetical protein [Pyrinomonadaceae bacterium]